MQTKKNMQLLVSQFDACTIINMDSCHLIQVYGGCTLLTLGRYQDLFRAACNVILWLNQPCQELYVGTLGHRAQLQSMFPVPGKVHFKAWVCVNSRVANWFVDCTLPAFVLFGWIVAPLYC